MSANKSWYPYAYLSLAIVLLDRVTKYLALVYRPSQSGSGKLLSFEFAFNRGVTWGMFHTAEGPLFYVVTVAIIAVTVLLARYAWQRYRQRFPIWGEVLVLTGSCSNLFDRAVYGGVIDFILLSYKSWSWPLFNMADMAIVCGVMMMFAQIYRKELNV